MIWVVNSAGNILQAPSSTVTCDTELTTADLDTGAGTDTRAVVGLVLAASGGGVLVGAANPMPVSDNGGSITVDGAVAATQSGAWSVTVSGSVTTADSQAIADNAGFTDGTSKVFPAGYIYDETAGTTLTENDAAAARVDAKRSQVMVIEDSTTRGRRATVDANGALQVGILYAIQAGQYGAWSVTADTELPTAGAIIDGSTPSASPTVGGLCMMYNGSTWDRMRGSITNGLKVDVTRGAGGNTATLSNVSGSASNVTLLAANAARQKVLIVNDSTATLYLKFGATASSTSYSVPPLGPGDCWEEEHYRGQIDGIWTSAAGAARITEVT